MATEWIIRTGSDPLQYFTNLTYQFSYEKNLACRYHTPEEAYAKSNELMKASQGTMQCYIMAVSDMPLPPVTIPPLEQYFEYIRRVSTWTTCPKEYVLIRGIGSDGCCQNGYVRVKLECHPMHASIVVWDTLLQWGFVYVRQFGTLDDALIGLAELKTLAPFATCDLCEFGYRKEEWHADFNNN